MMQVGVVIPLFNHERFIQETLESVLAQGRIVQQVIVVDDGSSDGSLTVARSVKDPRISVIAQENIGAHAALNRGINLLREECNLVAILNSDDRYLPGRLEQCAAYMQSSSRASLVVTALEMIDDEGKRLSAQSSRAAWYSATRSLLSRHDWSMAARLGVANFAMTTSNFVARRQWLLDHPLRNYRYVHDYRCLLDAAFEDVLEVIDQPLLEYRVHAANTIDEGIERLTRELLAMHLDLIADWAPVVLKKPDVRESFLDYLRMSWQNISSLRQDVVGCCLAALAAEFRKNLGESALSELIAGLSTTDFPELREFPNKRLVDPSGKLLLEADCGHLAERLAQEEKRRRTEINRRKDAELSNRLQGIALRSRWLALGRLLGVAPNLDTTTDTTSSPSKNSIKETTNSLWLRLGASIGSRRSRQLLAISQGTRGSSSAHPAEPVSKQ